MKEYTLETIKELGLKTIAFISALTFVVLNLVVLSALDRALCPCMDTCVGCSIYVDNWYCTTPFIPTTFFVILLIVIYWLIGKLSE